MKKIVLILCFLVLISFAYAGNPAVDCDANNLMFWYDLNDSNVDRCGSRNAIKANGTIALDYPTYGVSGDSATNSTNFQKELATEIIYPEDFGIFNGSYGFTLTAWVKGETGQLSGASIIDTTGETYVALGTQNTGGNATDTYRFVIRDNDNTFRRLYTNINNISTGWQMVSGTYNSSNYEMKLYIDGIFLNATITQGHIKAYTIADSKIGRGGLSAETFDGLIDEVRIYNKTLTETELQNLRDYGNIQGISDTTPPNIDDTKWNLTSDGGCTFWQTNKSIPCVTTDSTDTIKFDTDESATCAVYSQDFNYTDMIAVSATLECTTTGGTSHVCTRPDKYSLVIGNNSAYIGCKDGSGNENLSSTSGALQILYSNKGGLVEEDAGNPFYIDTSTADNYNPYNCTLNAGEWCLVDLVVTPNGTAGNYSFFWYGNLSNSWNYTDYVNVTVNVTGLGADTCTYGGSGNFIVDCCDNCDFASTNVLGNDVYMYGSCAVTNVGNIYNYGTFTINQGCNAKY